MEKSNDPSLATEFQNAKTNLELALKKEFLDTQQKAKCDWLMMGDEASSFFYARMSSRRSSKCLTRIEIDGKTIPEDKFAESAIEFYKRAFNRPVGD